jgi:hypothetical protein
MAQRQCDGNDGDGRGDSDSNGRGNSNGDGRCDGNAMATIAMDSARATAIDGATAMQQQWNVQQQCSGNRMPVVVTNIKIKEEEIARE